ncbi:MAG TPA: HAD hydrolase family protein [Candidatus Acidoferrales bacterium]|nr:HAD hydrolase family protein [Candidatus Acidoferrales bacterium]
MARRSIKVSPDVRRRAARIKLLLMDVDGTLTDGHVWLLSQPDGTALELKSFNAQDGQGLTLAATAGLRTGVITGRESAAMRRRAKESRIEFVYEGCAQKIPAYEDMLKKTGLNEGEVAYVGDDLPDLPVMRRVGLAIAVANAVPEVIGAAHWVTPRRAGDGAVRDVVELLLKSQGKWESFISQARA